MHCLLYLFFLLSPVSSSTQKDADTLLWQAGHPPTQGDFMGSAQGRAAGMAHTGLLLSVQEMHSKVVCTVKAVFIRSKSFLKNDNLSTLKHEQGHFDICEIFARRLRRNISELNSREVKDVVREIQKLYKAAAKELDREQKKYDKETEHSILTDKQDEWNNKITAALAESQRFESTEIELKN